MTTDPRHVLEIAFPGEEGRYFSPMSIGQTPATADAGAALILAGIKTATSSAHWDYPDERIPFAGALSVLVDGRGVPKAIVETERVAIMPFGTVDEAFARAYGEGERTLEWFRSEMGAWYREKAARRGARFCDETPIICEWIAVVRRL
jgi:histidinol-phosphate aminotransferase